MTQQFTPARRRILQGAGMAGLAAVVGALPVGALAQGKQTVRFCPDATRADIPPTAPDNLRDIRLPRPQWWQANRQKVTERFNTRIIS